MATWTHLIRFVAREDAQTYYGQLSDSTVDIGVALYEGKVVKARIIEGNVFDGVATQKVRTVERVCLRFSVLMILIRSKLLTYRLKLLTPLSKDEVKTIWCIGLNYRDHAAVSMPDLTLIRDCIFKPN